VKKRVATPRAPYLASARRSGAGAYPGVLSRLCNVEVLRAVATARGTGQLPAHRARRVANASQRWYLRRDEFERKLVSKSKYRVE